MGKGLHKSIKIYLSRLRKANFDATNTGSPNRSAAASWLLSACKYPKTPSFSIDRGEQNHHNEGHASTLSDVDRFIFENFNSLYAEDDDSAEYIDPDFEDWSSGSPKYADLPTDIRSSHRFFATPGTSNSLMEEARLSIAESTTSSSRPSNAGLAAVPDNSVAVMTFSKDPYDDFRRSMQEMVEARHSNDPCQPLDWDFMEDLLFCYLDLNDKSVHKHILGAFTDLTVSLRHRSGAKIPARRRRKVVQEKEEEKVAVGQ